MTIAQLAQTGILEAIPAHGRYLSCQLCLGTDPRPVLQQLAAQTDGLGTVVGLGESLVRALDGQVPGLKTFRGIDGALVKLPATPVDLLVWLRGTARGDLLTRSQHLEALLAPAFEIRHHRRVQPRRRQRPHRLRRRHRKPAQATRRSQWPFCPTGAARWPAAASWRCSAGTTSSTCSKPCHGNSRTTPSAASAISNEELDDAPESAHVKRTRPGRASSPKPSCCGAPCRGWRATEGGLVFTAFGASLDAFEALLRRMSGAEDGIVDALFTFTEPETGAYFWCPPMHDGQLDLRALGLAAA